MRRSGEVPPVNSRHGPSQSAAFICYAHTALAVASPAFATETITYSYDVKGRLTKVVHSGSVNNGVTVDYTHDNTTTAPTSKPLAPQVESTPMEASSTIQTSARGSHGSLSPASIRTSVSDSTACARATRSPCRCQNDLAGCLRSSHDLPALAHQIARGIARGNCQWLIYKNILISKTYVYLTSHKSPAPATNTYKHLIRLEPRSTQSCVRTRSVFSHIILNRSAPERPVMAAPMPCLNG
jgi:hypothetical protein